MKFKTIYRSSYRTNDMQMENSDMNDRKLLFASFIFLKNIIKNRIERVNVELKN